jgi:transmembrane sensor
MTEDRLVSLITRQQSGELTPEEVLELEAWANKRVEYRAFLDQFSGETLLEKEISLWNGIDPAEGFARWRAFMQARRRARIRRITGWSVAASFLLAVLLYGLIDKLHSVPVQPAAGVAVSHPVMPGRNTATLTLANGQQILLDSAEKGVLAIQGASRVVKADSGYLSYQAEGKAVTDVTYNVLTTPRSGQYQLTLPDGSRVWLNNVSSLRYPTSFQGKERIVELASGEAYFEIARDVLKPFAVRVHDETVTVLGTSFNVMAYPEDGGTQTTLLSGAVQVKTGKATVKLKPDEQAQVGVDGGLKVLKDVASQDIVSWKDGFFYFGRASFEAVMQQLARWYDVEVVYEGKAPDIEFGGKIDRSLPLNDLLKFLDKNQIHFRLQGRKLIVLPN